MSIERMIVASSEPAERSFRVLTMTNMSPDFKRYAAPAYTT